MPPYAIVFWGCFHDSFCFGSFPKNVIQAVCSLVSCLHDSVDKYADVIIWGFIPSCTSTALQHVWLTLVTSTCICSMHYAPKYRYDISSDLRIREITQDDADCFGACGWRFAWNPVKKAQNLWAKNQPYVWGYGRDLFQTLSKKHKITDRRTFLWPSRTSPVFLDFSGTFL